MIRALRRRLAPWIAWETYRRLTLYWHAADSSRRALGEPLEGVQIRVLERSELERVASEPEYEISSRFLQGLAKRDDLCVGAFVGGRLACYGFYAIAPADIDEQLRFHFPERWLYVYKGFTLPAFRGKRLRAHVLLRGLAGVADWLGPLERPIGLVTLVVSDNVSSLRALRRIGFQHQEDFLVLRLGARAYLPRAPFVASESEFCIHHIGRGPTLA